jgi:acyl carrier protein
MDSINLIRDFIIVTFVNDASKQAFSDDVSLIDSGIIDSLGIVKMLGFIERQFGFKVPEQDVIPEYFDSVRTIASYIERQTTAAKRS